jgi:signal transduction histidine kinase
MRIGVKTKQILVVMAVVFAVVATMGTLSLASIADGLVQDTRASADLLAKGIFNRASQLALDDGDFRDTLGSDAGLQSILQMSGSSRHGQYAAIVDVNGRIIVHSDRTQVGRFISTYPNLDSLVAAGPFAKTRAIFTPGGLTQEVRLPLVLGTTDFGSIRVAVSTLLMRDDLEDALRPAAVTALLLLIGSVIVATLLAQWTLRPIHLIRAGLARLGRGEAGVTLALPQEGEFEDLGESFNVVSARLAKEQAEGRVSRATVSRRLAALGRVSSGIAHEVKNPLNAMQIHLELLRAQTSDDNEHIKVLAQQA